MIVPTMTKIVKMFCKENGEEPIADWISKLDKTTQRIIDNRLARLLLGNYGDFKRINQDILELRFKIGPGLRVYFAEEDDNIVLLLCGGDKKTQKQDIKRAISYYEQYRSKTND